jgi:hypothetical protein
MFEQIITGVMPVITQAVISILGILVTFAVAELTKYLVMKKKALIDKMGVEQYSFYQNLAESVYYAVEQEFKNLPGSEKKSEFDKRLISKIPGLTQDDLDHFREYAVGKLKSISKTLLEDKLPPDIQKYIESPEKITVTRGKKKNTDS